MSTDSDNSEFATLNDNVKPQLHRNANTNAACETMRTFDVDKFLRRGKQHSAV